MHETRTRTQNTGSLDAAGRFQPRRSDANFPTNDFATGSYDLGKNKNGWTRRRFVLSLGTAAIAAGCESKRPASVARQFPSTFRWGCGSSAFQVEGALDVDGRGESIWDTFAKQNGRIKDGSTPSITCNSYYRYKEDAALMSAANLNSYKFSISWPRVFPTGSGSLNERGIDYYDRLTDALLQGHITPYVTLFHWDLPQRLYELGGWMSRDTGERFADYAVAVTRRLGIDLRILLQSMRRTFTCS